MSLGEWSPSGTTNVSLSNFLLIEFLERETKERRISIFSLDDKPFQISNESKYVHLEIFDILVYSPGYFSPVQETCSTGHEESD